MSANDKDLRRIDRDVAAQRKALQRLARTPTQKTFLARALSGADELAASIGTYALFHAVSAPSDLECLRRGLNALKSRPRKSQKRRSTRSK